jgi:hypothetical protein
MRDDEETRDDPMNESEGAAEEDLTPEDAPAEPAHDRTNDDGADPDAGAADRVGDGASAEPRAVDGAAGSATLPRTTTTGDDEQDYRQPGDGAVSGVPGDGLEDSGQRHEDGS